MKSSNKYYLLTIIVIGIIVRIYFFTGHIFSDDAYYSYLSYTLLDGNFANDYLGYPLFLLRLGHLSLTSISFAIFGVNEFATTVFPFLFSILNLVLTFHIAKLFTGKVEIGLISAVLMNFFPTDVIFASINFVDLPNVFFINLGLYFLYRSYNSGKSGAAISAGFLFAISVLFKENILYTFLLLTALLFYILLKRRRIDLQISVSVIIILFSFVVEGLAYYLLYNDILYRITILNQNYIFCYYDFFPYTAQQFSGIKNLWRNLFDQIVLINIKSVFLRRFYLFLPIAAMVQLYISIKNNRHLLLGHWFFGTAILLIIMTTSVTEYKPLDLQRSWYVFPLIMPMTILVAILLHNLKKYFRLILIGFYIIGGIIMCTHYEGYFNKEDKTGLKSYLLQNEDKKIFTDHFTKYSIDLIRNYKNRDKSNRIYDNTFNWGLVKKGDWILINPKHIDELRLQKFTFPDFSVLKSESYGRIKSFGDFYIYEKFN